MIDQQTEHNIRLTSTEMASLWASYMNDSMAACILSYFLEKVEDEQVRPVLEYALHLSKQHLQTDAVMASTVSPFSDKLMMFH